MLWLVGYLADASICYPNLKENKMKIGDIVKIVSSTKEDDRDLSGIIVDIKTDRAKVVWELTENIHTQGIVHIDRLIKHPHF